MTDPEEAPTGSEAPAHSAPADIAPQTPSAAELTSLIDVFHQQANDTAHSTATAVHTHLHTIQTTLTTHSSLLPSFLSLHYPSLSLHLLTRFTLDWLPSLTPSQRSAFDFFFSPSIPSSHTLLALASALRSPPPASSPSPSPFHSTLTALLSSYLSSLRFPSLLLELSPPSPSPPTHPSTPRSLPPRAQLCIDTIAALPTLLSNRIHPPPLPLSSPTSFFPAVLRQAVPLLSHPSPPIVPFAALLSKLSRIGHAALVMQALLPALLVQREGEATGTEEGLWVLGEVLKSVNSTAVEGLTKALLSHLASHHSREQGVRALHVLLSPSFLSDPPNPHATLLRHLLTHKLPLSHTLPPHTTRLLLSFLFHLSYPPTPPLTPHPSLPYFDASLTALARLWSTRALLHQADPARQRGVVAGLMEGLQLLVGRQGEMLMEGSKEYREWVGKGGGKKGGAGEDDKTVLGVYGGHDCIAFVMEGVQTRMGEVAAEVRKEGMRVAVEMSRLLDPTHPLSFDLSDSDDDADEQAALPAHPPTSGTQESGSEGDGGGVAYDLREDRSDLRKVPLPRYLRDVLHYLRQQEEREHIEAALSQADALIRSRPFDLVDVAVELCNALQQVATTVFLHDKALDMQRRAALLSLVVECPALVGPQLLRSFYSQSMTLQAKLEVLEVAVAAAEQLSGRPLPSPSTSTNLSLTPSSSHPLLPAPSPIPSPTPPSLGGREAALLTREQHTQVIAQRVEAKTRRWGRTRAAPPTTVNRFAPIAHLFFFPLISPAGVGEGDPILLTSTLSTLSALMLLACPSSPHLSSMVSHLLSLVLALRWHEHGVVRREGMKGVLRVVVGAPVAVLEGMGAELREVREWMVGQEREEAVGEEGRMMAALCRTEMDRRLGSLKQWDSDAATRGDGGELRLVVPNSATLSSPSSVRASPMIKFM